MANNKLVTVDVLQYNNEKIKEKLNEKIDIQQNVSDSGKLLGIGTDGKVTPVEASSSVEVSAEQGNAIVEKEDGLYVPTTAETKVSEEEGNAIETKDDGIYVAPTDLSDYAKSEDVYTKSETDQKIANAVTGGTVDLSDYVKSDDLTTTLEDYVAEDEVKVMTVEELDVLIGLSDEELEGLTKIIDDVQVVINKTWSSSAIYTKLSETLDLAKSYTLSEIGKASGASYKVVSDTTGITDTKYIYLIANANDSYDMYILDDEDGAVQIGETTIDLSGFYTKTESDDIFATKADVIANYVTKNELQSVIEDVEVEISTDENNQIETHENGLYVGKPYIEITQAEYDALSDDEKNNGIPYYITDAKSRIGAEVVTELNDTVTDEQVPSAKVVYDTIDTINSNLNDMIDITNVFTSNVDGCSVYQAFYKAGIVYVYFEVKDDVTGVEMFTITNSKYYPAMYWRQVVNRTDIIGALSAKTGESAITYYSISKGGYVGGAYVSYPVI